METNMNIFEETYNKVQLAKKVFDTATTEAEKAEARALYKTARAEITALGEIACRIYREYETSRDSGNDYLDISEAVWDKDVESLITCLRDNGIEHFTFSSKWGSAVETAWLFQQNGCTLEGLIEINSHFTKWDSDEHEKAHGYLFRVED